MESMTTGAAESAAIFGRRAWHWLLASILVVIGIAGAPIPANAASCPGGALSVVAHPDDDLLFLSPDLQGDVQAGRCVRSVFLTGGDGGGGLDVVTNREAGIQAAYAEMAGVANAWTASDTGPAGLPIRMLTLDALPRVSVVFLRLPDGNYTDGGGTAAYGFQSLKKLWSGAIQEISATDSSATYTRSSLISTLTQVMSDMAPAVVRTSDTDPASSDHEDHRAAGNFTTAAHAAYPQARTLITYQGYGITDRPENVTGTALAGKQAAVNAYAAYDSSALTVPEWLPRQYVISTIDGPGTAPSTNQPPVANAGPDMTVPAGSQVRLNGIGSSDPDGEPMSFQWTQTAGPDATLSARDVSRPSFTAPGEGSVLEFSLVVKDAAATSQEDRVQVSVGPALPGEKVTRTLSTTATASTQNTADGQTADKVIDGSPLGYPVDYTKEWASRSQGAGAWVEVKWPGPVQVDRVVLYDRPNQNDWITSGKLTFSDGSTVDVGALANDGSATLFTVPARSTTSVRLTVQSVSVNTMNVGLAEFEVWGVPGPQPNRQPIANAGPDQTVPPASDVVLNAASSSDPDGDALSFAWTQVAGPTASLSGAATKNPTFSAPSASATLTFSLVVRDATLESAADTVTVSVAPQPPVGLTATPATGGVALDWNDANDPGVVGYNVHRSASAEGPFTPVRGAILTSSVWEDNQAPSGTSFYRVSAVTAGAVESAASSSVTASIASANLLANPSFEVDANTDNRPDSWTSTSRFLRNTTSSRSGSYSGRHLTTSDVNYTVGQTVTGLTAGRQYVFTGWVNIPATSDSFTFSVQVQWRNASGKALATATVQSVGAATADWLKLSSNLTAPTGATQAVVNMVASSLKGVVYVDDLAFRQA